MRSHLDVLFLAVVIFLPGAMIDRDEGVLAVGQLDQIVVVDTADDLLRELLGLGHEACGCPIEFLEFLRDHLLVLDDQESDESRRFVGVRLTSLKIFTCFAWIFVCQAVWPPTRIGLERDEMFLERCTCLPTWPALCFSVQALWSWSRCQPLGHGSSEREGSSGLQ